MAHNIYFNEKTNQHSFFSVQEKPWHSLGQIVKDYPTSKEALTFAGLDFTVEKQEILTANKVGAATGEHIPIPDYFATVRTDTGAVLGVVGKQYEVVQNTDAFLFFDAIVKEEGILYETACALG